MSHLTEQKTLNSARDRVWHLYVHRYSMSVSSAELYRRLKHRLLEAEQDRSGAATTAVVAARARTLQQLHPDFKVFEVNWFQWKPSKSDLHGILD